MVLSIETALNLNVPITRRKSGTFSQVSRLLKKREKAKQSERPTFFLGASDV